MNSSSLRALSAAFAFSHGMAAPPPEAGAMREILAIGEPTSFAARFGTLLDGLDAKQVADFRATLAEGLNHGGWPTSNAAKAMDWTDQTWARLDPKGLLEAAATRQHPYSADAQLTALGHLLRQDREIAISLYLNTPANENFGFHCQFYERLAALDPPRAARLFLESPDVDRTFANPLESAFGGWARQDLKAAWAAANQITRKNWRDEARETVLKEADRTGQRQTLTPEENPAVRPAPDPAPAPAPQPEPAADDATLEQLLADGYQAYNEKRSDPQGKLIERLFIRFPERSLEWLHQMDPHDSYASNRYRDLAAAWPKHQLPAGAVRMLDSKRPRDREFGFFLACHWMKAEPETAVPLLLSRYPALAPKLCRALPFYELTYPKKQSPEEVRSLLDRIAEPASRDLALREFSLYQLDRMAPAEALPALVALPHEEDRLRAAATFVRGSVRNHPTRRMFQLIAGLGVGHEAFRDHLLSLMPAEILDTNDADRNAIPEILSAIRDPELVMKACEMAAYHHIPVVLNERLIGVLTKIPPGGLRDRRLNELLGSLPPGDAVRLLEKSQDPFVSRSLLLRIPWRQVSAVQLGICLAALEALPAAWRDEATDGRWIVAQALRDPTAHWQDFVRYYEAHPGFSDSWSLWDERMKSDPQSLAEDLAKTRPGSLLRQFLPKALLAAHDGDFTAAFGKFRLIPDSAIFATTEFFSLWFAKDPAAAASHSLLIGPDQLRLASLGSAVKAWAQNDAMAAGSWLKRLPDSPERTTAANRWLAQVGDDLADLTNEIKKLLPQPPAPAFPNLAEEPMDPSESEGEGLSDDQIRQREARAIFLRNRATFRALAELDFATTAQSIRKMPDGELRTAAWFGLLEHATATGKDDLAADLTAKLLAASPNWKADLDRVVLTNTPLPQLAKALACANAMTTPDERHRAAATILKRWSAPEHRAAITRWLQSKPDSVRRADLARLYLREILYRAAADPTAAAPDFERPIRQAIIADARAQLLDGLLDHRPPDPELIKPAALDDDTARLLAPKSGPPATYRK